MPQKLIRLSIDFREKSSGIALTIEMSTFAIQYQFSHLLESFGSIENVMEASVSELSEIPGIGLGVAGKIHEFVHSTYQEDKGNLATDIDFRKLKF